MLNFKVFACYYLFGLLVVYHKANAQLGSCTTNSCNNNGFCLIVNGQRTCTCLSSFTGLNCETQIACINHMCQNGGYCQQTLELQSKCVCPSYYTGQYCQERITCSNLVCRNGGYCNPRTTVPSCVCTCGFTGKYCETEIEKILQRCDSTSIKATLHLITASILVIFINLSSIF